MGLETTGTPSNVGDGAVTVSKYSISTYGSICFWVIPSSISGNQRVLGSADAFEGRFSDNTLYHEWGAGGTPGVNTSVPEGVLAHVCATWNLSSEDGELFVNGVSKDSDSTKYNDSSNDYIAMFNQYGDDDRFIGELYDIRIYNRVLSLAEIVTIYNSRGADSIVYGLKHRWVMDEKANGTTLSGTGIVKDRAEGGNNFSSASEAPKFSYNAVIYPRRR